MVGQTGSGKSTIIGLLLRFYVPQKGKILIDGQDIQSLDLRRLRASIGIVQQDVFLFSGTHQIGSMPYHLLGNFIIAQGDVGENGVAEKENILQHHSNIFSQ